MEMVEDILKEKMYMEINSIHIKIKYIKKFNFGKVKNF
jgi:hypothetical protein